MKRRELDERGDWFQTASGRQIFVLEPEPELIVIEDIAHALARICRFGGHVNVQHYSVAQHSVLVSRTCFEENELVGLLHDASEAYIGDMIRPLKYSLPQFKEIEVLWEMAIDLAFELKGDLVLLPDDVKIADKRLLATERRDLISDGPGHRLWDLRQPPLKEQIVPLDALAAQHEFLARFRELNRVKTFGA